MEQNPNNSWNPPPPIIVQTKSSGTTIAIVILLVIILGSCVVFGIMVSGAMSAAAKAGGSSTLIERIVAGDRGAKSKAALIRVEGVIGAPSTGLSRRVDMVELLQARLEAAEDALAVILEINSPGGGVHASERMYRLITDFKRRYKVPVVAVMEDVAASGGYYIAAAADWIIAAPSTLTGSIGVVIPHYDLRGLLEEKLGVKSQPVKSADEKDILSPSRAMSPEERERIQAIVDETYARFIAVVVQGRAGKLQESDIRALKSTILTGQQALAARLVDQLGYREEAIAKVKELTGASSLEVRSFELPPSLLETLTGTSVGAKANDPLSALAEKLDGRTGLLYLWRP